MSDESAAPGSRQAVAYWQRNSKSCPTNCLALRLAFALATMQLAAVRLFPCPLIVEKRHYNEWTRISAPHFYRNGRCSIDNTRDYPWLGSATLKQSLKSRSIGGICKKRVAFITLVSKTKSVIVSAILSNYCRSSRQPLSTRTKMISFTENRFIAF